MNEDSEHFLRDARDEKRREVDHEIEGSGSGMVSDEPDDPAGRHAMADDIDAE